MKRGHPNGEGSAPHFWVRVHVTRVIGDMQAAVQHARRGRGGKETEGEGNRLRGRGLPPYPAFPMLSLSLPLSLCHSLPLSLARMLSRQRCSVWTQQQTHKDTHTSSRTRTLMPHVQGTCLSAVLRGNTRVSTCEVYPATVGPRPRLPSPSQALTCPKVSGRYVSGL